MLPKITVNAPGWVTLEGVGPDGEGRDFSCAPEGGPVFELLPPNGREVPAFHGLTSGGERLVCADAKALEDLVRHHASIQ